MSAVAVKLGYSNPDEAFVEDVVGMFADRAEADEWVSLLPEPERWEWTAMTVGSPL